MVGALSKPLRRRHKGRGRTKDLMGRLGTIARQVRMKILYISLLTSAKQSREISSLPLYYMNCKIANSVSHLF